MNKNWEIKNRMICLYPTPEKDGKLTLKIKASKYWEKKNYSILPIFVTDLIKGQNEYALPKYIHIKSIMYIDF